ncbi:LytR C-terminal domain-containing protein, partial [Patescibacteria group bacterium]|nr:LytR C-terminal domain-containing protein [Patescibacteria group bacterium]
VSSNLDISQSIKLAKLISQIDEHKITTNVITVGENGLLKEEINIDGAYVLKTKSGNFKNLARLADEMFKPLPFQEQIVFGQRASGLSNSNLNQEPVLTRPEPKIIILNGTYINGLAKQTSEKLNEQNLTVIKIGNAPRRNYEKTIIYTSADEFGWSEELRALQSILKTDIINDIPEELKFILNTNQADFLIIVGNE